MNEALALLLLAWIALFVVPGVLRFRNARPHATVGGFTRAMDVLGSETRPGSARKELGRRLMVPSDARRIVGREVDQSTPPPYRREDPLIERRRVWFLRLVVAAVGTLILGVALGGWLWLPAVLTTFVAVGYTFLMRRLKLQRDEARRVVRELDLARSKPVVPEQVAVGGQDVVPSAIRLRRWDN